MCPTAAMSRVFSLVLFIALVSGSALALGKDDPADKGAQQEFVNAFLNVRKGEELERTGDLRGALATYLSAAGALAKIKKDSPGWQKDLVDFRLKKSNNSRSTPT